MALERETVIVFDIRNFSVHRLMLGQHRQAKVMTHFVKAVLDHVVAIFNRVAPLFDNDSEPLLSHTGDGFVLVVRGRANAVLAFFWISKFQQVIARELKNYHEQIKSLLGEHGLPQLDYGIGLHHGPISTFTFKDFKDKKNRESRTGFLGTPVNIASRVEQCTKDSPYRVLCTKRVLDLALIHLSPEFQDLLASRFSFVGAQALRGLPHYTLYGFNGGFHRVFKHTMLRPATESNGAKRSEERRQSRKSDRGANRRNTK